MLVDGWKGVLLLPGFKLHSYMSPLHPPLDFMKVEFCGCENKGGVSVEWVEEG